MKSLLAVLVTAFPVWAAVTGSVSGTVRDQTGAVIPGAMLTATNTAQGIQTKTGTDVKGFYSFPSLAVGRYDLQIEAAGFQPLRRTGLVIDADAALTVDVVLEVAQKVEAVTVESEVPLVETASTQMGEVIKVAVEAARDATKDVEHAAGDVVRTIEGRGQK